MIKQAYFRGLMKVAGYDQYNKPLMATANANANAMADPIDMRRLQPSLPAGSTSKPLSDVPRKYANPWKKGADALMRMAIGGLPNPYGLQQLLRQLKRVPAQPQATPARYTK